MDNHYIMREQTKEKSLLQSRMDTSSRNQSDRHSSQLHQQQQHHPVHHRKVHPHKQPTKLKHLNHTSDHHKHHKHSSHHKHRHYNKHKSHRDQHKYTKEHNRDNNNKRTGHRSFRKSTFHKNGRIYVLAHQDWYTQYRRQRGPRSVMGSTEDGETGAGGQEVGEDEIELRGGGDLEDESLDRETETIQAVKRPTVVGVPESISYQQKGLIPKARSAAAVVRRHCRDSRMDNRQRG
ncbi:hypothetical protein BGX33_006811 [Mortierella sp. NVP41]|nr:hypothetical protein BGX33_006811 [Mortierella sp. NVP41]